MSQTQEFLFYILMVIAFAGLLAFGARLIDRHIDRKSDLDEKLYARWKHARLNRLQWLEENRKLPTPFLDSEYERLWQYEIAAATLWFSYCPPYFDITSYTDYKLERDEYDSLEEV